jgi:ethanolamine utilization protein EutQ (cupin superfamily)
MKPSRSGYVRSAEALPVSNVLDGRKLVAKAGDIQYSSKGYTLKGLSVGN